jgi:ribosomal protein S18 acetylase RimI-like enzyme
MIQIRKAFKNDVNGLKEVLDSSELFPSEYLDDMMLDYFNNSETEEIWFTAIDEFDAIVALGYCVPEKLTNKTYNLLAIAVRKELQGKGIGNTLMNYIEDYLRKGNKRILIVETSSDNHYELTRKFYLKLNYIHMATIKDFWNEGENKIVFWKKIN